jgi:triacylglycerol esterase/lipase EstA (alpha/beta hydrolase family)
MLWSSMAPARRRLFLTLLATGVVTVVLVAFLWLLDNGQDEVVPVSQSQAGPVLLVPGYGGSTSALDDLAAALEARGKQAVIVPVVGDGTGDLREQAEALDAAARETMQRTGAPSVDVVGYSAGGVIARMWVKDFGGGNLARRVVTLGSPHHGTAAARFAAAFAPSECPEACQQLRTDSDLINELNAGDETPAGPVWVSLWSNTDELVVPVEGSAIDGAINAAIQSLCGDAAIAHGDIPRTASVQSLTLAALTEGSLTELTSDDC